MGKGDKRSRRGKIFAGSFGKTRPKHKKKNVAAAAASATEEKPKTRARKKTAE
ncbi:MAG TPA: 30S ribosomal protein THX [Pyrinomonadaceae bacterium]|jgi:30S ribosomal protein S31|nr:30S ribosomal protein THX [Pyrinomonadaceae bacterium]